MSRSANKRLRRHLGVLPVNRDPLPAFAWPGGYPLYYGFRDGGVICPDCVNKNVADIDAANRGERRHNSHGGWAVDAVDTNWEDDDLHCDHCHAKIPCAYPPDDPPGDEIAPDDWVTTDHLVYREHETGRVVVSVEHPDDAPAALIREMKRTNFFPNLWFISDHGNVNVIVLEDLS